MTNKKAIEWLKLELEKGVSWDDTSESTKNIREQAEVEIKEAFDMAIKALEQQEKTAAWVGIDQEPHEIYECNSCGWLLYEVDTKDFRFCPSCGARMQESEVDNGRNKH